MIASNNYFGLLDSYDIPLVASREINSHEHFNKAVSDLGVPLVLKNFPDDQSHKEEAGRIILNLQNHQQASDAYLQMQKLSGKIVAQKMIYNALEVMIGAKRDPVLGKIIVFGDGGKLVEIKKDVAFRITPLSKADAIEMIQETNVFHTINRYYQDHLLEHLAEVILKVAQLLTDHPNIIEMDLNPVFITKDNIQVADVRIIKK